MRSCRHIGPNQAERGGHRPGPGLWIWRLDHPEWNEHRDWQEVLTSTCVDAGDERWLLDPLLPPADATEVWDRLAERPPTAVALLIPTMPIA
jgi:hypothetical protein